MILSEKERIQLQQTILDVLRTLPEPSPGKNLLVIILALISDFEELRSLFTRQHAVFVSGKEITELLDSLANNLTPEVCAMLQADGQAQLINSLMALANSAQVLQRMLTALQNDAQPVMMQ